MLIECPIKLALLGMAELIQITLVQNRNEIRLGKRKALLQ
jgi:hypothetical protein